MKMNTSNSNDGEGDEKGLPIPDEIEKLVCHHCKKVVCQNWSAITARKLLAEHSQHVKICFPTSKITIPRFTLNLHKVREAINANRDH